jgi:hypothetical protein
MCVGHKTNTQIHHKLGGEGVLHLRQLEEGKKTEGNGKKLLFI